jgi:8-oxo-dGTP diphosphatase
MASQRIQVVVRLLMVHPEMGYLCLKQTKNKGGALSLPGGRIDSDETAKLALVRELKEEINIQISPESLDLIHVCHRLTPSAKELILLYRTTQWEGSLEILEKDKFKSTRWVAWPGIHDNLTTVLKFVLAQVQEGKLYSEFVRAQTEKTKKSGPDLAEIELDKIKKPTSELPEVGLETKQLD